jgi:hypothetical protein
MQVSLSSSQWRSDATALGHWTQIEFSRHLTEVLLDFLTAE